MAVEFNKANYYAFIYRVEGWVTGLGQNPAVFRFEGNKSRRQDSSDNRPFSILHLKNDNYIAVSDLCVAAGGFGRIKVAFPFIFSPGHGSGQSIATIDFTRPLALKVLTQKSSIPDAAKPWALQPDQHSFDYMQKRYGDAFDRQYRHSNSSKRHVFKPKSPGGLNKLYYTMPLYWCDDLFNFFHKLFRSGSLISEYELTTIFLKMAQQIELLHQGGYAHCDVKLENFLIDWPSDNKVENATVHLVDLDAVTKRGRAVHRLGTRGFQAPEFFRDPMNPCTIDLPRDIYALGVSYKDIFDRFTTYFMISQELQEQFNTLILGCKAKSTFARFSYEKVIKHLRQMLEKMPPKQIINMPLSEKKFEIPVGKTFSFKCRFM